METPDWTFQHRGRSSTGFRRARPFALCPLPLPVSTHYALPVDWQQIAALGVVGVTVTLMAWRLFRPRRLDFRKTTGCGCGSTPHPVGLVITGRRGETPRILLKTPPR